MQKPLDYLEIIELHRARLGLTFQRLAKISGIPVERLKSIWNREALLGREEAFFLAMALEMSPLESEKLALLSVYSNAKTPEFKQHIYEKFLRISQLEASFDWTSYISSTLKPRTLGTSSQNN